MATLNRRRLENASGNFYVDSTCIDCDTCRWMAPDIYSRVGSQSAVYQQPNDEQARLRAMQALLSCPTASIGTVEKPTDIRQAQASFPIPIAETVYHCGYHSEDSFGAASYLIQRPDGNVLVDSPRFTPPLVKRLEQLGGIRYLYLTHRDDVADHARFHQHFGCDRILHQDEISYDTQGVEIQLFGLEPMQLETDLLIIPVPGHTKGHTVLLYNNTFLFTGDHLAWSDSLQHLYAFRRACWYSWSELIKSMYKLANYSFEWVLPGHGRRYHADRTIMQQQMQQCLNWMERQR
ncbi:MBL fold metallo-hydrolase [Thermocoleostomius sinensis]|uniref:MBL fold metallo-hydrolase n=1 Tax=Thermocoleostomius sinensis A174 TaxID=2016057 RepID=A0A9E8ZFU1_9CYAN|nr:MBL fold metallo-hydrolase [Thermocoleostomius sinensis]WAL62272.1 MBL fold metallo-hydrolase [Thermocoleostomius sinensis A174]